MSRDSRLFNHQQGLETMHTIKLTVVTIVSPPLGCPSYIAENQ
jgi:hypothetical protein